MEVFFTTEDINAGLLLRIDISSLVNCSVKGDVKVKKNETNIAKVIIVN